MLATRLSVLKASQAIRWVRLSLRVFYKAKISILGCILISLSYNLKQRPHPLIILRCSFEHKNRTTKSLYPLWLYILYQVKKKLEVTWKHDPRVWLFVRSYLRLGNYPANIPVCVTIETMWPQFVIRKRRERQQYEPWPCHLNPEHAILDHFKFFFDGFLHGNPLEQATRRCPVEPWA